MKRALIFASVASMIDQFNMRNISILQELGYEVDVACNFETGSSTSEKQVKRLIEELKEKNIGMYHIPIPRKLTTLNDLIKSFKETKKVSKTKKYDIVHCHSPIGGVIARQIFKDFRKKGTRVIYTAHGFHFFKGAPLKNWLIYYPIEKWYSKYTDTLITINKEDKKIAKEKLSSKNLEYIPGIGIETKKNIVFDKEKKLKELKISTQDIVLLSVGELNKNKNHEIVIKAISELQINNIQYIVCGKGELDEKLNKLVADLNVSGKVKFLGFRNDIDEICMVSDLFIFPSYREGLSVALMEAMSFGLPVICSNIRGNIDLIDEGKGGYLQPPSDILEITKNLNKLLKNKQLRNRMGDYNKNKIREFDKKIVDDKMRKIYTY
ncbi:glycosyltransferase family 4 protein [Enterococcus lemanii]|uniref:Glycosyltransferase family 4 protein n=1 Tax=Enterococcus lemanii TaxID=1159752 RepID=A0ABV9MU16_9ENTE|nr:glycosyltransferase family 4 protein [Enterococcus lemanii]MBM7709061.1 glycosyltransferase involved in cell wall biosynthesis [Enterococcus lemanii]